MENNITHKFTVTTGTEEVVLGGHYCAGDLTTRLGTESGALPDLHTLADAPCVPEPGKQTAPHQAFGDVPDLISGFTLGVIHTGEDFIEFLASPQSIINAAKGAGANVETAFNYYKDKFSNGKLADVASDACTLGKAGEGWIAQFPNRKALERGEIIGSIAAQMAMWELGASAVEATAKGVVGSLKASELASKDAEIVAKATEKVNDTKVPAGKERIECAPTRVHNWGATADFHKAVELAVSRLSPEIQELLQRQRVSVNCVHSMGDAATKATANARGMFRVDCNAIFLSERFNRAGSWINENETIDRVLNHEVGHMIDLLDKTGTRVSDSTKVVQAYEEDLQHLTARQKYQMDYYATGTRSGRTEAFAEAYAILNTPAHASDRLWRRMFASMFPKTLLTVKETKLP